MPNRLALCGIALVAAVTFAGRGGEESPKSDPAPSAEPSPTVPPGLDAPSSPAVTLPIRESQTRVDYVN